MSTMDRFNTRNHFGFIGFGLIGGSIAHCIRKLLPDADVAAYNYYETKRHPRLEQALADGVLSRICTSLEDFSLCDVIFLCAPVLTNIAYLKRIKPYLKDGCILTDVGSVKGDIHRAVAGLGLEHCFIGGHPMTGSEKVGYAHSDAAFLKDCYYILTPTEQIPSGSVRWMQDFVTAAGARCVTIDVKEHDRATAGISHAPHVISAALVNAVHARDQNGIYELLAAGGFKDITRISSSSPDMWQDICLSNKDCILEFLEEYADILDDMKKAIKEENGEAIGEFFERAKAYRDQLIKKEPLLHKTASCTDEGKKTNPPPLHK